MSSATYEEKAQSRIRDLCREAYLKANTTRTGKRARRHVPYSVPSEARALVEALGMRDRKASEERVKSILMHGLIGRLD